MNMENDRIVSIVQETLGTLLKIPCNEVNLSSNLVNELGIDSVDTLDMLFALEDRFKIKVTEKDVVGLQTVKDIIELIERKLAQ